MKCGIKQRSAAVLAKVTSEVSSVERSENRNICVCCDSGCLSAALRSHSRLQLDDLVLPRPYCLNAFFLSTLMKREGTGQQNHISKVRLKEVPDL